MSIVWTKVRGIGNSIPSKISLFIPVIAFFVLQEDTIVEWLGSNKVLSGMLSTGKIDGKSLIGYILQLKLYFLYFGAHIFGLASAIYYIFCPDIPRRYQTSDDYIVALSDITTKRDLLCFLNQMESRDLSYSQDEKYLDIEMAANQISQQNSDGGQSEDVKIDTMKAYFEVANSSRSIASISAFIFYVVAILLLGLPAFATFYRMVESFIGKVV